MMDTTQLKKTIAQGKYESINNYVVHRIVGKVFPRRQFSRSNKLVFSLLIGFIFLLLLLIAFGGNVLAGLPQPETRVVSIFLLGAGYIFILCIVIEFMKENFLKMVQNHLFIALVKEQDRQRLLQSLETNFSIKRQFWFGLIFSLAAHTIFIVFNTGLITSFSLSFIVVNLVFHAFHGFCVYFYVAYLNWANSELKNYEYDLFELDPSNTAIVSEIANLLQSTTLMMTLMVALASLIFSSDSVLSGPALSNLALPGLTVPGPVLPVFLVLAMVVLMWLSTITLYFFNRNILKSIIAHAKWQKLSKIQAQIRDLETKDKIPTKETLDHITQLKEYHDKIKDSPDSPWNFIKFLTTLNTLILPTLGIIASNVGDFQAFIDKLKPPTP